MESIEKEIKFLSGNGTELYGKFIIPCNQKKKSPIVVILTGDGKKGSKSSTWTKIPSMLVNNGIATFIFDFEGLGLSNGDRKDLCLTIGLDNITHAMKQVYAEQLIDQEKIGLLGSSFGGNVAVLYAANDSNIKAIGLKSPVSFYPDSFVSEFGQLEVAEWTKTKLIEGIGFTFYIDAFGYNTYFAAMQIKCPCIITHGDADEIVPVTQSIHLNAALNVSTKSSLKILKNVGHSYSEQGALEDMAKTLTTWFDKVLNQE